jgi:hypothetical protein
MQTDGTGRYDELTVAFRICSTNTLNYRAWSPVPASPQSTMRNQSETFQSPGGPRNFNETLQKIITT